MKTAPTYFEYWAERYRRRAEEQPKVTDRIWQEFIGRGIPVQSGFTRLWRTL